ncbi:MAG: FAD-binding oxidoreductase [Moorea sp. SIO3G5]|nr:FAD-binding oxidoreductase [Moorena sp. SIO3G5]
MKVSKALEAWVNILGSGNVLTSEVEVTAIEKATFATTQKVLGVIKPSNRQEVQASVKIANQYKITIYPISCGKNWWLCSRLKENIRFFCEPINITKLFPITSNKNSI